MEELTSTVLFTRPGRLLRDWACSYRIEVDGELTGRIRPGKTLRMAVPAGTHTVQARVQAAGSKKYRLNAAAGQEYVFEVRPSGPALTAFTHAFRSEYIRLTPTGPNISGGWDDEIDRSPIIPARTFLYSELVKGLLGATGGLLGATAAQRLFGVALGLLAALLWTVLVHSGRLRSKRRNTPPPIWHNVIRLVITLVAALIGGFVLVPGPQPPIVFGIGLFLSYSVLATIVAIYLQKWYRLASARLR